MIRGWCGVRGVRRRGWGFLVLGVVAAALISGPQPALASTTITVSTLADTTGGTACSLREAIANFNAQAQTYTDCGSGVGAATIDFSVTGTIKLNSALPTIALANIQLTIDGGFTGTGATAGITIDAQGSARQFVVGSAASLVLENINLVNGHAPDGVTLGDGGSATSGADGGSILNSGSVNLQDVRITDSQAGDGGGVLNGSPGDGGNGGAIANTGPSTNLNATDVTLDHNESGESGDNGGANARPTAGRGGAIYNAGGVVNITNGTLAYNSIPFTIDASRGGAGIYSSGGTVNALFSTFAANTIATSGSVGEGFGVFAVNGAAVTFENTIMSDVPAVTTSTADCWTGSPATGTITDAGYNLETKSSCGFTGTGSAQNADPELDPGDSAPSLQSNLGTNQTIALRAGSPAVDRIPNGTNDCGLQIIEDERGFERPWPASGSCDVGAYEAQPAIAQTITFAQPTTPATYGSTFNVNPTSDSGLPVTVLASGACEASAASSGYTVTMTSGTGTCTLTASQNGNLAALAATDVTRSISASKQPLTVTADDQTKGYTGLDGAPTFTVSYSGFVLTDSSASLGGSLAISLSGSGGTTYGPSSVPPTDAGTYTISPSGYVSDNYDFTYSPGTYTISRASQFIVVDVKAPASASFGTTFTPDAYATSLTTVDGDRPVSYTSGGACSNVGALFTMTSGTGTCYVYFDQSGGTDYSAATEVVESVTAEKASQTVSFTSTAPAAAGYGDTYTPTASGGGSGEAVTFGASGSCSYSSGTGVVTMTGLGSCTVTADQAGNADYSGAPGATQVFTVGKQSRASRSRLTAPVSSVYGDTYTPAASGGASGNPVTLGVAARAPTTAAPATHDDAGDLHGDRRPGRNQQLLGRVRGHPGISRSGRGRQRFSTPARASSPLRARRRLRPPSR